MAASGREYLHSVTFILISSRESASLYSLQSPLSYVAVLAAIANAQLIQRPNKEVSIKSVRILCNSNDIVVSIETNTAFNGMIYPKGLSKNSSCMAEFREQISPVLYKLPLKSCSTMSSEMDDGIEYFNTVVVQPHRKLVTNQGRGYHIRCKYQTQEKTVTNAFNVSGDFVTDAEWKAPNGSSFVGTTPLTATAPMPGCYMRIFAGTPDEKLVAENVRIGDPLTMSISLDDQEIYGMKVTDCLYSPSKTSATVRFQAHKFPYISSVYYQCNVKLCIKNAGGCDDVPPLCVDGENVLRRRRRRDVEVDGNGDLREVEAEVDENLTIEVFTGLYVNEDEELPEPEGASDTLSPVKEEVEDDPNTFCLSPKTFAIGIAIAGLILMVAVIASILILISRRRRRKEDSTTGSSIYSSPYTNTAYSHSS
ncbi:Cuticlin-1 [Portunus trituberculatus]|uniref:Cuticlin-1 n=1 Tax=Portunus trituberculatus TaxID=210409 RepID=A0A5B7DTR2_PORTR|nr:Cuticlin-1 [Portunus trituberculatus]